jgi:hypothetical protein
MADKNYKSQIELQAEFSNALKDLKAFEINSSKIFSIFDNLSKTVNKSFKDVDKFTGVLSEIPKILKEAEKATKNKSFYSKESIKEIDNVVNSLKDVQKTALSLSKETEINIFRSKIDDIAKALDSAKSKMASFNDEIGNSEKFGKTLQDASKFLEILSKNEQEIKNSSKSVYSRIKKQKDVLQEIIETGKKIQQQGDNSVSSIDKLNSSFEDVKNNISTIFESAEKPSKTISNNVKEITKNLIDVKKKFSFINELKQFEKNQKVNNESLDITSKKISEISENQKDITNIKIGKEYSSLSEQFSKSIIQTDKFNEVLSEIPEFLKEAEKVKKNKSFFSKNTVKEISEITSGLRDIQKAAVEMSSETNKDVLELKLKNISQTLDKTKAKMSLFNKEVQKSSKFEQSLEEATKYLEEMYKKEQQMKNSSRSVYMRYKKERDVLQEVVDIAKKQKQQSDITTGSIDKLNSRFIDVKRNSSIIFDDARKSSKKLDDILNNVNDSVSNTVKLARKIPASFGNVSFDKPAKDLKKLQSKIVGLKTSGKTYTKAQISEIEQEASGLLTQVEKVSKVYSGLNQLIEKSNDSLKESADSTAKLSFEKASKDAIGLMQSFNKIVEEGKATDETIKSFSKELNKLQGRFELTKDFDKSGKKQQDNNIVLAETQKLLEEINDEQKDISSANLKRVYDAQSSGIKDSVKELQKSIMLGEVDNDTAKQKLNNLNKEKKGLRRIKQTDDSLRNSKKKSAKEIVNEAKRQTKDNKQTLKDMWKQKKSFGDLAEMATVFGKSIKPAAVAKFGKTGVIAAQGIEKALGGSVALFSSLMPIMGLYAFIQGMLQADKATKAARKQIAYMAADTHTLGTAFEDVKKGITLDKTAIESMRAKLEDWTSSLGMSMEQGTEALSSFVSQGFKLTSVFDNLKDELGLAAQLGMEVSELAKNAGMLRTEYTMSLTDISSSFVRMRKDAEDAGISTSIFFDKVINASVGLGLYGKKIDTISKEFGYLAKNMKLPEAIATKAAADITNSFQNLSTEMQVVSFRQGKGNKFWKKSFTEQASQLSTQIGMFDEQIEATKAQILAQKKLTSENNKTTDSVQKTTAAYEQKKLEEQLGNLEVQRDTAIREKKNLRVAKTLGGINAELYKARKLNPNDLFQMRMQDIFKEFAPKGVDITGDIEKVNDAFKQNMYKAEKLGELFGFNRETMAAIQEMIMTFSENSKAIKESFGKNNKPGQDVISVLKTTLRIDKKGLVYDKIKNIKDKQLISIVDDLKKSFPENLSELSDVIYKDEQGKLKVNKDMLSDIVSGIDTNSKKSKDLNKAFEAIGLGNIADILGKTTKSSEILNTISKMNGKELAGIVTKLAENIPNMSSKFQEVLGENGSIIDKNGKLDQDKLKLLAELLSKIPVSISDNNDFQSKVADAQAAQSAKLAGLQILNQTKSVEDAINNTITKWIRKIYLVIENIVGMLTFLKPELAKFNKFQNDLSSNQDATANESQQIDSKILAAESARAQEVQGGADEKNSPVIQQLDKQIAAYKKQKQTTDDLSKVLEEQRKKIQEEGKVTNEQALKMQDEYNKNLVKLNESKKDSKKIEDEAKPLYEKRGIKIPTEEDKNTKAEPKKIEIYKKATDRKTVESELDTKDVTTVLDVPPGFAKGGKVPGSSFTGDKVLTALNSGEVVFNKTQMGKLQAMLTNKSISINIPEIQKLFMSIDTLNKSINQAQSKNLIGIDKNKIAGLQVPFNVPTNVNVPKAQDLPATEATKNITTEGNKIINDNSVVNINANNLDIKTTEKIVYNAIYEAKRKRG